MRPTAVIVVELALGHFLRREADAEIVVEAVAVRGHPLEAPAHASAEALDLGERRARDGDEGDVAMGEMHGHAVGVVGHVGAARAALLPARREHEVLHQELVAAGEQIGQRLPAVRPIEGVRLVDANPRQLPAQLRDVVAAPRQVLFGGEQIAPRFQPLAPVLRLRVPSFYRSFGYPGCPLRSCDGLPGVDREIDLLPAMEGPGVTSVSGFRWTC